MFSDGGGEIIVGQFPRDAAEGLKSVDLTADVRLKTLDVCKLHIHLPAVAFDQREGVELALIGLIVERAEVSPVDLKAVTRRGLDAHIGPLRCAGADATQMILQYGESALIPKWLKALRNDRSRGLGVMLKQCRDVRFEGVQFTNSLARGRHRRRRTEILGDGPPVQFQMACDFAQ